MESSFAAASLLELLIFIVWDYLQGTPRRVPEPAVCPLFARFFQSLTDLHDTASEASLCFAPGLFDVLKSATPPALSFFRSLPPAPDLYWGVYVILLEKLDCRPRLYVGSATKTGSSAADCGLHELFAQYDRGEQLPSGVKAALDEGFTISHKGALCYAAQPSPAFQGIMRVTLYALEAAFAYIFWAMKACPDNHGGMAKLSFWDVSILEWDGICSHCALRDGIQGHFHETPEQVAAHAKAMEERRRARKSERSLSWYHRQMTTNYANFTAIKREQRKKWLAENQERYRETRAKRAAKVIAEKRYHCKDCDHSFLSVTGLEKHLLSDRHLLKVGEQRDPESEAKWEAKRQRDQDYGAKWRATNFAKKRFTCDDYDRAFHSQIDLKRHLTTDQHLEKVGEQLDSEGEANKEARRQRDRDKQAKWHARNIAEKKHHCQECNLSFATAQKLRQHKQGPKHKAKVQLLKAGLATPAAHDAAESLRATKDEAAIFSAASSTTSKTTSAFDVLKAGAAKQASKVVKGRSKTAKKKSVQAGQPLISTWLGKQHKD